MGKRKGQKAYIGEDGLLHPLVCARKTCSNPIIDNQERFCSKECCTAYHYKRINKLHKGIHKNVSKKFSPRRIVSKSSIKHNEHMSL